MVKETEDDGLIPRRYIGAAFLMILGLLIVTAVVGLWRNQVNEDGLIVALMPVITGVILGPFLTRRKDGDQ